MAKEGMEIFATGAEGGGLIYETVWRDAASEFLQWELPWRDA